MGLFPSCCTVTKGTRFPNIGDPPFPKSEFSIVRDELLAAFPDVRIDWYEHKVRAIKPGTEAHRMASCGVHLPGMVKPEDIYDANVFRLVGYAHGWRFSRNWYYWCAHNCGANAVRREVAEEFNLEWREQVRVNGFAGGQDVRGDVDCYHVDTVEGFAALAALLRSASEPSSKPSVQSLMPERLGYYRIVLGNTIEDLVHELLNYGRKDDEELPRGKIEELVAAGATSAEEIADHFRGELESHLGRGRAPGKVHELKCLPEHFRCVMDGTKRVELRRDDRGYEVGDHLTLMEWTGDGGYSGRYCTVRVTHVLRGEGWLARNTVALSIVHV